MTRFDPLSIRDQFPALSLEQGGRPVVYLDGPGGTQVPQRVIDAVAAYYRSMNANDGGAFQTSQATMVMVAGARAAVADLLGARDPDQVHFGANMTTLTFHVSRSIGATLGAGRRDRGHDPRSRGERVAVAGAGRGSRPGRPDRRYPGCGRHPGPGAAGRHAWATHARGGGGHGVQRPGHHQPGAAHRADGPRAWRAGVHGCRPLRAPSGRRRRDVGRGPPGDVPLQVVRAAFGRAVGRCWGHRPAAGLQGPTRA